MKSKAAYFGVFIALALIFSYVETSQSDGDGRFKKDKSVQFAWNQCDGRRFSQCWPVNHGCSCIGEFEHWILSSGFTYIGACDRNFDWYHLW